MNALKLPALIALLVLTQTNHAQILQFHCVNSTRSDDRIQDLMNHVLATAEKQEASSGDQLYYFISGLRGQCPGYSLDDCRRCAKSVEADPPYSRELEYHWEKASAMFNEIDFIGSGPLESANWEYDSIEWHFYYGGDDIEAAKDDIFFIDPLLRISGTKIEEPLNKIFLHIPVEFEESTRRAVKSSPVLRTDNTYFNTY